MDLSSIDNGRTGKGLIFVISSVSGGGKTTVIRQLMEEFPDLRMTVSHTTRSARHGEIDGRDYHFISQERFNEMVEGGLFLEWAHVYGKSYGTTGSMVDSIQASGLDAILDIDVQGAMQVKARKTEAVLIFILPPGEEAQRLRLERRGCGYGNR